MKSSVIAVDVAKNVFEVAVSHVPGRVRERRRLSRSKFLPYFEKEHEAATVVLEACGSSHHWARELGKRGHRVVLLPPHAVRPYVTGDKTDRTDTKGILEAYRNDAIHPVPVKTVDQQAIAGLHRLRSGWVAEHTARINAVRGILRELGIVIPAGAHHVVPHVHELLGDPESPIPAVLRPALHEACEELRSLKERMKTVERELKAFARDHEVVGYLCSIPGIGLLTATALVALVGDVRRFRTSRRFASYLGLTPRERSSGDHRRLGSISKRGDVYLRTLLLQGGRSILLSVSRWKKQDSFSAWAQKVAARRGFNRAVVAVANKLARFVWVVWRHERPFEPFGEGSV